MDQLEELRGAFRPRNADADKYSVGTVVVIGGSEQYVNAPVIAGLGARAAGAGLVRLMVPEVARSGASVLIPEATFVELASPCVPPRVDAIVLGMGLGRDARAEGIVASVLSSGGGRFVIDADALALVAEMRAGTGRFAPGPGQEFILTPHEGEAAKLLGVAREEISRDRRAAALAIAERYCSNVVLKGPKTLVVSADRKRIYENSTGNPFMALGGMGDLLAGVIGARWAYLKDDPFLAAAGSVWLHGLASDSLVEANGDPSIANTAASIGSLRTKLDI